MMLMMSEAELNDVYERSKVDAFIAGSEVRQLVGEIRHQRKRLEVAERLVRVDAALAKRVGDHIARDSELRGWLQQWLDCYSIDIFPAPDLKKAAAVLKDNGMTLDALSADMGRHILTSVLAKLNEPAE
jgi:hypothetical protein